jgi:predicted CopG family antitoxin
MVKVITIMDDVYAELNRMKSERNMSFSELFRDMLAEREKKRDIMSFANSVPDFEIDKHTIDVARKTSRAWKRIV